MGHTTCKEAPPPPTWRKRLTVARSQIKLFTWQFMDFHMTTQTSTRLFTIQKAIAQVRKPRGGSRGDLRAVESARVSSHVCAQRHGGSVSNLLIYKNNSPTPENILEDESKTLADFGIEVF